MLLMFQGDEVLGLNRQHLLVDLNKLDFSLVVMEEPFQFIKETEKVVP